MKMKTGLMALGMFTLAGAVTISCGGSSDDDDDNGSQAGTSSTAGSGTGGSTAGTPSTGGTGNSTAGTGNGTAGSNPGGGAGNGTAGSGNNNAGDGPGPGAGGDGPGPGAGGAGNDMCPATQPMNNETCTIMGGMGQQNLCTYGDTRCTCRRANGGGNMRRWQCLNTNPGAGGDNGGPNQPTCPENAKDNDACTGFGQCPGQQGCVCFNEKVNCF